METQKTIVNSKEFLEKIKELNYTRQTEMMKMTELRKEIKAEEVNINKEIASGCSNTKRIAESAAKISSLLKSISLCNSKIADAEELIIMILELSIYDCNIYVSRKRTIDSEGNIYNEKGDIVINTKDLQKENSIDISDIMTAKSIKSVFGLQDNDINIV